MDAHEDHAHHAAHPLAGAVTVVVIALIFGFLFSLVAHSWTAEVVTIAVILGAWGLVQVLGIDKD